MGALHTIDYTPHSAVVVCHRPGCAWRAAANTPASVWRLLAAHAGNGHADTDAADYATKRARRRQHVS